MSPQAMARLHLRRWRLVFKIRFLVTSRQRTLRIRPSLSVGGPDHRGTSDRPCVALALKAVEQTAQALCLTLNPTKCGATSLVTSGRGYKIKVLARTQFSLSHRDEIHQLGPIDEWRYLGVNRPQGPP
ncbi:hypothetical protein WA026_019489 [Henosepilachna vigintioctopunctata]|uniref:Uncharacterized protein n=1 Tax=Henosepilachna vigintioctopunctata TaxID=420089 RepID=A0AAW1UB04_9CUCU